MTAGTGEQAEAQRSGGPTDRGRAGSGQANRRESCLVRKSVDRLPQQEPVRAFGVPQVEAPPRHQATKASRS